ncbi:hypothetical protein [Sinorhizobium psoraleae]|uniref:Uncharacterized protein n=1 Tax=Sinorhizobium psoraleae TaxID=520838 RepID=A0ABT4KAR9_9HYPH|nr:hypothetical protein [Sinorhizobium psoraleae]MCZ4089060.1 hypothetical protein [Sinorhizobium psoraleae]
MKKRRYNHYRELHLGNHHNEGLQIAYNQSATGNNAVEFKVLELCDADALIDRERAYISALKPEFNHYDAGGGNFVVTDEFREKQRKRLIGKQLRKVGDFVTPWGTFPSSCAASKAIDNLISQPGIWLVCSNPEKIINRVAWAKSRYLQTHFDETVIGKSWKDIGFDLIKTNENQN